MNKRLDKAIGWAIFAVVVAAICLGNYGCTQFQASNCEGRGGTPITRYFDLEYTGCAGGR